MKIMVFEKVRWIIIIYSRNITGKCEVIYAEFSLSFVSISKENYVTHLEYIFAEVCQISKLIGGGMYI